MMNPVLTVAVLSACLTTAAFAQTCTTAERSVLLILDASGSMNARLPNGETRIAVTQRAIKGVASFVPTNAGLSLRMYGAQSSASQKNCGDTHLAVPFGPAGAGAAAIATSVDPARAQGYTPIAYSLDQAAGDFPIDAKERVIVLVSDGKETCQGDPVVAAKVLARRGITIHTVGFVVDTAARGQPQARTSRPNPHSRTRGAPAISCLGAFRTQATPAPTPPRHPTRPKTLYGALEVKRKIHDLLFFPSTQFLCST